MNINRSTSSILLLAASFVLAAAGLRAAAPAFVLAAGGEAKAVVVPHGGITTNGVNFAARELADYLGRLSGAQFMVADKPVPGYRTILVGTPYKPAKFEELSIKVKDANTLEITGDGPRGTLYGVYDFIESFGVVFCAPEYEYVPTTNLLAVAGDYARVDAPVMEWRSAWGDLNNNGRFAMKHRIHPSPGSDIWKDFGPRLPFNISQGLPGGWFPWKAKFWEAHPDWYSYNRTKKERYYGWVCPSSEGMYEELFKEVEAWIQKNPGRQVSLGVSDGARMCECDKCQELERKYPELNGSHNAYIQMIEVVNRVARHFARKYPDVVFNFLCYGDLMPTNPDYKLEPNVGAGEAELWRNHCLSADNNERSERSLGQLTRITPNAVYVWDYLANFSNYMIPFPNHSILGQTLRFYDRLGVKGVDSQTAFGIISDMSTLNFHLFGKLHWNPYLDERAITEKYVNATYGAGARWVMEYLDILEHARLRQRFTWYGCYVPTTDHYLTGDDSVKIQRAFDAADNALRRDPPRRLLLRRARIAALINTIFRYNDMLEPAERLRFKLAPLADYCEQWKQACFDASNNFGSNAYAEHPWTFPKWGERVQGALTNAPHVATRYARRSASIVIPAARMTGGSKMGVKRDPAGFDYAQVRTSLTNDVNDLWMRPTHGEVGYTIAPEDVGDWYTFATVRLRTDTSHVGACYFGLYEPCYANGFKINNLSEVADMPVDGRKGEEGWRTLCLGRRLFTKGARMWIMNGILENVDFVDVKDFTLIDPALIEGSVADAKDAKAKARSVVVDPKAFDRDRNVRIEQDKIDGFAYARLANVDTNAPVSTVSWTVTSGAVGEWDVLMRVRVGAAKVLDMDAAIATVTIPAESGDVKTPARVHVTGSLGDEAWQVIDLGRVTLEEGMKVNLVPRADTNDVPRYVDVRSVVLLNPEYKDRTQPALPLPPAAQK
jgi:hypothetical protein